MPVTRSHISALALAFAAMLAAGTSAAEMRTLPGQSFQTRFAGFGPVRFVSMIDYSGPPKCRFELHQGGAVIYRFPAPYSNLWACSDIKAVAFRDVNADGRTDVIVMATAITGIGPTAAKPFQTNTVYYAASGGGGFVTREKINEFASKYRTVKALRRGLARSRYASVPVP
jgi:hypothetical protein